MWGRKEDETGSDPVLRLVFVLVVLNCQVLFLCSTVLVASIIIVLVIIMTKDTMKINYDVFLVLNLKKMWSWDTEIENIEMKIFIRNCRLHFISTIDFPVSSQHFHI